WQAAEGALAVLRASLQVVCVRSRAAVLLRSGRPGPSRGGRRRREVGDVDLARPAGPVGDRPGGGGTGALSRDAAEDRHGGGEAGPLARDVPPSPQRPRRRVDDTGDDL